MPWDYSNLVAIHYLKCGLRVFLFYDTKPGSPNHKYTGCYVDDGQEYAGTVMDRLGRDLAPVWRPEGAGIQEKLI